MRVLVACEYSGRVREAFRALGHDAWSCDLLKTEQPGQHIVGDVLQVLNDDWDLLIAHPPCTYLANSGERWLKGNPERKQARIDAVIFVLMLWQSNIPKKCIENPIGHLSTAWQKPTQIVQPFYFGHHEWKSTCLWLHGLPKLTATEVVQPDSSVGGGKRPGRISSRLHKLPPGADRQKQRSLTYQGIADAMAAQWG